MGVLCGEYFETWTLRKRSRHEAFNMAHEVMRTYGDSFVGL